MTDGNVSLGDDEIDKLIVLRMNREFMQYYAHRFNEPFGKFGTVLTVESKVTYTYARLTLTLTHSD